MKGILNWQDQSVVNIFDEVTLWAAPFGRLLLENIPMKTNGKILDIGFGTGFPLIELAQRFGNNSKIYGMDIWQEGINVTKEKMKIFGLENITLIEKSAEEIPLENNSIDLITSNLGVNNFENKEAVLNEIYRVLKKGGHLCITTNPIGTFRELFKIFETVINEMRLAKELNVFQKYIAHRNTKEQIIKEVENIGFNSTKIIFEKTNMRFTDAQAIFDHALIRVGFLASWYEFFPEKNRNEFIEKIKDKIENKIKQHGEFKMTIPMLYLEFEK